MDWKSELTMVWLNADHKFQMNKVVRSIVSSAFTKQLLHPQHGVVYAI